jgi:malonyl CoA-acyl carrier protein transacylase
MWRNSPIPQAIRDALVRQAASPVRWVETMQAMQAAGVTHVFECGPGKVLSGLVKRCADQPERRRDERSGRHGRGAGRGTGSLRWRI